MLPRADSLCRASYIEEGRNADVARALRTVLLELVNLPLDQARLIFTGLDQLDNGRSGAAETLRRGSDLVLEFISRVLSKLGDPITDVPSFGDAFTALDNHIFPLVELSLNSIVRSRLSGEGEPPVETIREEVNESLRDYFPLAAEFFLDDTLPEGSEDCRETAQTTTSCTSATPTSLSSTSGTETPESSPDSCPSPTPTKNGTEGSLCLYRFTYKVS